MQSGELTSEQLDVALQLQTHNSGKHLGEVLTDVGMLSKDDLYHILCTKLGVPLVDVAKFDVDPSLLNLLPDALVRAEHILPLCYHEGSLVVAVPDALDSDLLGRIRFLVDRPSCAIDRGSRIVSSRMTTSSKGRVGMYELLVVTPEMRQSILHRAGAAELVSPGSPISTKCTRPRSSVPARPAQRRVSTRRQDRRSAWRVAAARLSPASA